MLLIRRPEGAIVARERARKTARDLGFGLVDQTKIAFAVSELALKLIGLSEQCKIIIESVCREEGGAGIEIRLYEEHEGEGTADAGWANSLADDFDVSSIRRAQSRGTHITFRKWLLPAALADVLPLPSLPAAREEI